MVYFLLDFSNNIIWRVLGFTGEEAQASFNKAWPGTDSKFFQQ
jgi:hypothetical protein